MAAIFQIRRGTSNATLADGELYLHKGLGSIQFSSGSANPITLLPLGAPVSGNIILQGNITASNAYFTGDVAISGNLFLGNNASDNINALGVFTSDIKPGTTNQYSIGTTTAVWSNIYANNISASSFTGSFSGSIGGIDFNVFSTSVDSRLDNVQDFTASVTGTINHVAYFTQPNRIGSYQHTYLGSQTFGLGTDATSSAAERLMVDSQTLNIATFQTSQQESYAEVNIKNFGSGSAASADLVIWNDVTTSGSGYVDFGINSSNYTADYIGYQSDGYLYSSDNDLYIGAVTTGSHGHLHLFGGFLWKSSSISIYNDGTIGINTDKLNNSASTIPTAGYAMEISGGVKFNNNVDFIGNISSSTISGIGNVTTYSQSVDNRLDQLQEQSASLHLHTSSINLYTQSANSRLDQLSTDTGSQNNRLNNIESYTSSLKTAIDVTGGNTRILGNLIVDGTQTSLNTTNVYIEDFKITLASGSANGAAADGAGFEIAGANVSMSWENSNNRFGINTGLGVLGAISSSTIVGLNGVSVTTYSTSVDSRLTNLQSKSASVDISISNINAFTSSQNEKNVIISSITASYNTFTSSINGHVVDINIKTGSFENKFTTIQNVTASYNQHTASLNTYTQSVNGHITDLNSWTASQNQKDLTISGITSSYDFFTGSATASIVSLFGTASNHEVRIDDLEAKASTLQTYTASVEGRFTTLSNVTSSLNLHTASLNTFTASTYSTFSTSVDLRLDQLEYTTSILTPEGQAEAFNALNTFTSSANIRLTNLESTTSSLNTKVVDLISKTGSYATTGSNTFVGDQIVSGSMTVTGTINATTINTTFVSSSVQYATGSNKFGTDQSNTHQFTGSVYVSGSLYVHSPYVTVAHFEGDQNGYAEFSLRNVNTGLSASTDLAVYADNGTAFTNYVDVGINNSGLTASYYYGGAYFGGPNDAYMYSTGNDLRIGNATAGKYLYIFNNGTATPIIAITPSQGIEISGSTIFTNGITGSIRATNGIVSGSSQITISSTTGYTAFSSSLDSKFDTIETYTSSNDTLNTLQTTRIDQLAASTASVNSYTQSVNGHIADINLYTSSLKTAINVSGTDVVVAGNLTVLGDTVTLNVGNLSVEDKTIVIASGSTSSTLADGAGLYISGADASILWNHLNTRLDINKSINVAGDITLSGTVDGIDVGGHVSDINTKTGSFETKFGTIGLYTASVDGHIVDINAYTSSNNSLNTLQTTRIDQLAASTASLNLFTQSVLGHIVDINTYTGSNNTLNSLQTTRIDQLAASTASVNSFTSSIDTTIKTKLNVEGVVSGSSQITLSSTTGGGTTANVQFGSLGIGTTASGVSGEIRATGDIVAFYSSDERLKENITPIENAINKINQMGGYNYDWKEGFETIHSHKGHDLGVIAQEVQSVLPEVVTERETGYLAVDYIKLVPVLIEAIKELSAKIDRLENK